MGPSSQNGTQRVRSIPKRCAMCPITLETKGFHDPAGPAGPNMSVFVTVIISEAG